MRGAELRKEEHSVRNSQGSTREVALSAGRGTVPGGARPGTISPWSSKATDIALHCGLEAVERLERGVAFYIEAEDQAKTQLSASISEGAGSR